MHPVHTQELSVLAYGVRFTTSCNTGAITGCCKFMFLTRGTDFGG